MESEMEALKSRLGGSDLSSYVCNAEDCVRFKFVSKKEDFEDRSLEFAPSFTHQVFGENENIFGYQGLRVQVFYTPGKLDAYVGMSYTSAVDPDKANDVKLDNVVELLAQWIPEGFSTNIDHFVAKVEKDDSFKPFGEKVHEYSRGDQKYEVYKVTHVTPTFQEYYSKLSVFLIWYIDGANYTDADDSNWTYYLLYEVSGSPGHTHFSIAGFTTTYNFYAYPDKTRLRISQMLVLPPFQRQGHGAEMMQVVYNDALSNSQVQDITVEDPSDEFVALRDYVDCRNAQHLPCFQPPLIHEPFGDHIVQECRGKLKLNKQQSRKVYEILRLRLTDRSDEEMYKNYRVMVKTRLNAPFKREQNTVEKLIQKNISNQEELKLAVSCLSKEERLKKLEEDYAALELQYCGVIEKLAASGRC
jgi:histone acetyltransferase 1